MTNSTCRWASLQVSALLLLIIIGTSAGTSAAAQEITLELDPATTSVRFTLDAALHSVHGAFRAQPTALQFDPVSGRVSGQIVIDARSGDTGNGMRDRKMHKEVLESESYPEVSFRPDRVEGAVSRPGKSSVKVHGMFNVHGIDREITVPAEVEMTQDHWTAVVHFTIPYAKWGMKNPSNLFLHVSDSVEIDLALAGSVVQSTATTHSAAQ
jgi:polyisoprenoid-binding protein YceI